MTGNAYRNSIQRAVEEALAANVGEEQIRQWVDEKLIDAVDYYPEMHSCAEISTP